MLQRLRSITFMGLYLASIAVTGVLAAPIAIIAPKTARPIAQFWARTVLWLLKWITGLTFKIEGREHMPTRGAIIAANHQSQWETLALFALTPRPVMVLKKELLKIPVYGWWAIKIGAIAIDRTAGAKALRAMRRQANEQLSSGEQIVVFPEGTRTPPGTRRAFHPGVAGIYGAGAAPCVPVAHNSGEYWLHPGPYKRAGAITLRYLPPIAPGLDSKSFLRELKLRIEDARPDLEAPLQKDRYADG